MFEPILHKTGPDAGCAPRFFFIAKDVSNIFSNNIEGRSNCKRDLVVDTALILFLWRHGVILAAVCMHACACIIVHAWVLFACMRACRMHHAFFQQWMLCGCCGVWDAGSSVFTSWHQHLSCCPPHAFIHSYIHSGGWILDVATIWQLTVLAVFLDGKSKSIFSVLSLSCIVSVFLSFLCLSFCCYFTLSWLLQGDSRTGSPSIIIRKGKIMQKMFPNIMFINLSAGFSAMGGGGTDFPNVSHN